MKIAIIQSGTVGAVGDYKELFPNTSFSSNGPSDDFLAAHNAKKVNTFKDHNNLTQKLVPCAPYNDGSFVSIVKVESLTADEIQSAKDSAMSKIRTMRNQLLKDCDWTQLEDSNVDKQAWATYRQALRNLPSTIADPRTFTAWPHNPDWVSETI